VTCKKICDLGKGHMGNVTRTKWVKYVIFFGFRSKRLKKVIIKF